MGGDVGSFLAHKLSEEGWRVELFEKNPNRHVICGGLISNDTLSSFPVLEDFVIHRIDGAVITAGKEEVEVFRRGVAWVIDRDAMLRGLIELATSSGVEVVEKEWVPGRERGKVLVGADGAVSSIRPMVTDEEVSYILGYQGLARWKEDDRLVRVDFGEWSPNFFGWVIPLGDGNAHVGVGVDLEESGNAKKYLSKYAKHLGVKIRKEEGRVIPVSKPLKQVAKGNVVLVGDAAVQTKASTGGGLAFGLKGADLATEAIGKYLGEDVPLEYYNTLHKKQIRPKLLLHWVIHRIYTSINIEDVIRVIRERGLDREISERGKMDDPSFFLSPAFLPLISRIFVPFLRTLPELF